MEKFGFTKAEKKIYLALLALGSSTAGPLIKKTGLHRATVYDGLRRLVEKGFVAFVIKGGVRHFQAVNPSKLIDLIKEEKKKLIEKEKLAKKVVKQLKSLFLQHQKENVIVFQGKKAVKSVFSELIKAGKYCVFTSTGKFKEILGSYFHKFQKMKKEKRVKAKLLIDERLRNTKYVREIYGKIKFIPKEHVGPTATFVYNNKVLFVTFTSPPIAVSIENKELADSFKDYFNLLWKNVAKK